jgi:hypothetical protein
VSFKRADPSTGIAEDDAPVETIRVQNVYVYPRLTLQDHDGA